MPKIVQKYKDNFVLCSRCQRYLPKESFFERLLRNHKYECKECHRKYVNEYNHKHGVKSREEQRREQEEHRQKEEEKRLLENPFEELNLAIKKLLKERGEYQQKEDDVCGYCDTQSNADFNRKKYCRKHLLIELLSMGKPLSMNTCSNSPELARKLGILKELEDMGVKI